MKSLLTHPLRTTALWGVVLFAAIVPSLPGAAPVWAAAEQRVATSAVKRANETLAKLLAERAGPGSEAERKNSTQVTERVRDFLDVDELGQRALGEHWARLTSAQRREYLTLLRELIERNYLRGLRANLSYQVVYRGESPQGETRIVSTEIRATRKGRPYSISIDYVMRKEAGRWRAFDVVTDGVGLVENYRAQFGKIIAKDGFAGLMERMRKKRDQI